MSELWQTILILVGAPLAVLLLGFLAKQAWGKYASRIRIRASVALDYGLPILEKIGCPGLILKIVCVGNRTVKIQHASICVEGEGFMRGIQHGFNSDFGHEPAPGRKGRTETLAVQLYPLSPPNAGQGFILERDDACSFCLPLLAGPWRVFIDAPPSKVTIRAKCFDGTEKIVLKGTSIQAPLKELVDVYGPRTKEYSLCHPSAIEVRTVAKSSPKLGPDLVGTTNPRPVRFDEGDDSATSTEEPGDTSSLADGPALTCQCPSCGLFIRGPSSLLLGQDVECPNCHAINKMPTDAPQGQDAPPEATE